MRKEFKAIVALYGQPSPYSQSEFIDGVIKKQLAKKISEPRVILV